MMQRLLRRDFLPKGAALLLAVLMWVTVINDKNPLETRLFDFHVEVQAPAGKTIVECVPSHVSISLEGRARTLSMISPEKLHAEVDLFGAASGKDRYPVTFASPYSGMRVVDINPKTVMVDIDVEESREIPVGVEVRGVPHDDYEAGEPVVEQEYVRITGPKRVIAGAEVALAVVNVDKASEAVIASPKLSVRDAQGNEIVGVHTEPVAVQVTVPMISRPPLREVKVLVDTLGTPRPGYKVARVSVTPDSVKIRAESGVSSSLKSVSPKAVNIAGVDSSFSLTVDLVVPLGLAWIETTKVTVKVDVVEDLVQREFAEVPVLPDGVLPGFTWTFQPNGLVSIVVEGRRDVIDNLDRYDVEAYVDVGGRGEGTYTLAVGPRIPQGVRLVEIKPNYVTIVLTKR